MQTILRELNDLLRWGAFLTLFAASRESASALSSLESIALGQARRADDEGFSQSMTAYYLLPNRVLYSDTACNKAMFDQV